MIEDDERVFCAFLGDFYREIEFEAQLEAASSSAGAAERADTPAKPTTCEKPPNG